MAHFDSAVTTGSARVFRDGVEESDLECEGFRQDCSLVDAASKTCDMTPEDTTLDSGWIMCKSTCGRVV